MTEPVFHPAFWVEFEGRVPACVEAEGVPDAIRKAEDITGKKVVSCKTLPYPAEPRLNKHVQPHGSATPSFCFRPEFLLATLVYFIAAAIGWLWSRTGDL